MSKLAITDACPASCTLEHLKLELLCDVRMDVRNISIVVRNQLVVAYER